MRVAGTVRGEDAKPLKSGSFKQALHQVKGAARTDAGRVNPVGRTGTNPGVAVSSRVRVASAQRARVDGRPGPGTPEGLALSRQQMHADAGRLLTDRRDGQGHQNERASERLLEMISRELCDAPGTSPEIARAPGPAAGLPVHGPSESSAGGSAPLPYGLEGVRSGRSPAGPETAATRAASALELVTKIEAFVRSQRPALALTLNSGFGTKVEIERLGPKQVAVKVHGRGGPPAPEDLARLRDELRARGLTLSALSVS